MFQTKLTYGMICYRKYGIPRYFRKLSFKLSWLMVWFVISGIDGLCSNDF